MIQNSSRLHSPLAIGALALTMSCAGNAGDERGACDQAAARTVVEQFGKQLQNVSLLAPERVGQREIRQAYTPYVTPALLEAWVADPRTAPGRQVSSPWPAGIDITSVDEADEGGCIVEGEIRYVSSADAPGGPGVTRHPVALRVVSEDGWRVASYEAETPDEKTDDR